MKFFYFVVSTLAVLACGAHGRVQEKLVGSYTDSMASPAFAAASQGPVVYTRTSRPVLEQKNSAAENQQFVAQPAAYAATPTAQQFYQAQPQAVAYPQPAVAKFAPGVQKIAYVQAQQPQRRPQQYSSAADVSSFSYTSPIVAYSNLGVLRPISPRPQHQPQHQIVQAATSYTPAPVAVQYTAASNYPSASNQYESPAAYQTVSQKQAYSEAQPQASTYQQAAPTNQKYIYQAVPAYQVQATQKLAPQVTFAPSQQFTYQSPQAAASQNYEVAAHSIPQVFYAHPAQPQYYSTQPKYSDADIIYGH